ncbi:GlxA family transcriptional regulator [Paraburkholderia terrae]|uniref:AraC family transcriptional regulator n=1 Tax=Paraburkholderia terrae TaxID=311230 RepID=A0A2I8F575_9BURK|nr:helix-turn-helix domain-containing protein [Paraburkholderia terrae]AUT66214.1 AraC family transcriptional regulator [Paraburkholderia terrae]
MRKASGPISGTTRKRVVILGLPPVDALDVIGPAEVFASANQLHAGAPAPYSLELVCAGSDVHLESETGIGLKGHRTLETERRSNRPIDTLIVTTGFHSIDRFDKSAIDWLRKRSNTARRVCSICVGAFALAEAGLLDGRRATTHWRMTQHLAERYPGVQVDPVPIWVKDGNLYTSAGVSAGIDLALALVGEDLGNDAALEIAKNLVLFLRRPGGQAQFSVALQSQRVSGSSIDDLCLWISEHLHTDLTTDMLADKASTSVRTLIRMFQRELKTTPAKYVEDVRLEAVRRALELGERSMEEIARRCGYGSGDVLRKAFTRRMGVSPREYARRFAPDSELP